MTTTNPENPRQRRSFLQRIAEAARKARGSDGCWRWTGPRNHSSGYPRVRFVCPFRKRIISRPVHRAIMERELGRPLTRSEHVLHRPHCSKDCVRPDHLRIGNARENTVDARAAGRLHNYFLRPWQVRKIVELHNVGLPRREIAERFGCQPQTVWAIVTGRAHRKTTGITRPAARHQPARPPWRLDVRLPWQPNTVISYAVPAHFAEAIAYPAGR